MNGTTFPPSPEQLLWAKTSRDPATPTGWHPLLAHSLDTLAVATWWMEHHAPRTVLDRMAAGLGWSVEQMQALLPPVIALHDIGKATPAFQAKWDPARSLLAAGGLGQLPKPPPGLRPHGPAGFPMLQQIFMTRFRWDERVAEPVARAVASHHGLPVTAGARDIKANDIDWAIRPETQDVWTSARRAVVDAVVRVAALGEGEHPPPRPSGPGIVHLMGATTVLDWIASQEEVFGCWHSSDDISALVALHSAAYFEERALPRAAEALAHAGLPKRRDTPASAGGPRFADLFPAFAPHACQSMAEEFLGTAPGQFLLVVEDAMGQGKTEIALMAVAHGRSLGAAGTYFALPTRATSDQAFRRLREFLEGQLVAHGEQMHLLHSTAWMNDGYRDLRIADMRDEGDHAAGLVASEWFARPKRGLLGTNAVGTIDQAMLGALTVRHHWVRLWGLAGKVVVLDEVHAYDTYMTAVIERLVGWLGALGASVVLLSATLPARRRRDLVEAFQVGAGWQVCSPDTSTYPRVMLATRNAVRAAGPDPQEVSTRRLHLEWCDGAPDAIAREVSKADTSGGCIAIVCNTVRRAQEVFDTVRGLLPGEADDGAPLVHLFTSRFRNCERRDIEGLVRRRYGKEGEGVERPPAAVLVATQVVEQSLDIDFDLMVTEFAPADLILQRAGRVHRHPGRPRPPGLADARVLVVRPDAADDGEPEFESGTRRVYEEHVLVRTLAALGGLPREMSLPVDIDRVVQETYADDSRPPDALRRAWERTAVDARRREEVELTNAAAGVIAHPGRAPFESPSRLWNPEDEAEDVATRLGADSRMLVVATPADQPVLAAYPQASSPGARAAARRDVMSLALGVPPWSRPAGSSPPREWRDDPVLRRASLVQLDFDGRLCDDDARWWRYDKERGWAAE